MAPAVISRSAMMAMKATASLFVDGGKAGEGSVGATAAMIFSADDGCDIGSDTGSPVAEDYGHDNAFNGEVKAVLLSIAEADGEPGQRVSAEEAIRVAMARQ